MWKSIKSSSACWESARSAVATSSCGVSAMCKHGAKASLTGSMIPNVSKPLTALLNAPSPVVIYPGAIASTKLLAPHATLSRVDTLTKLSFPQVLADCVAALALAWGVNSAADWQKK